MKLSSDYNDNTDFYRSGCLGIIIMAIMEAMRDDEYDFGWRIAHTLFWGVVGIILCLCFGCTRHV